MHRPFIACLAFGLLAGLLAGCGGTKPADGKKTATHDHDHDHDHDHGHGHHHEPPHGGTLVVLGDHFAHLELVLDAEAGKLTAYVLDGEAKKGVRLAQETIKLELTLGEGGAATKVELELKAQASDLTGEKVGDSSEFTGQADALKGVPAFGVLIKDLSVKGQTISDLAFKFPEGNEGAHGHGEHEHEHDH